MKPLPFDPAKLKGLSEKLLTSHHQNNYAGAVKRLNSDPAAARLAARGCRAVSGGIAQARGAASRRTRCSCTSSTSRISAGNGRPDGTAAALLQTHYGSLETWEHDFRQTALSLGGGSGWVVVAYDPASQSLHNWWAWDHSNRVAAGEPVLVLDLYEHAYAMDYGAATKGYLDAFLQNVSWDEVNRRVERLRRTGGSTGR